MTHIEERPCLLLAGTATNEVTYVYQVQYCDFVVWQEDDDIFHQRIYYESSFIDYTCNTKCCIIYQICHFTEIGSKVV